MPRCPEAWCAAPMARSTVLAGLAAQITTAPCFVSTGAAWTESVLYSFTILSGGSGGSGGQFPTPVFGPDGALYGTTAGTVFQLLPPDAPGGPWTETLLYSFPLPAADPSLIMGCDGTLYGFAYGGAYDQGMIFALSPPQSPRDPWTEYAIYNFTGTVDGSTPISLITGPNGVLYGTTAFGGSYNDGVLFQLSPPRPLPAESGSKLLSTRRVRIIRQRNSTTA